MANNSKIEWTDATWDPVAGCSVVSEGCTNCYAMGMAARIEKMAAAEGKTSAYDGLTRQSGGRAKWTGEVRLVESALVKPLRWRKPRMVFVNSMSDLFHEGLSDYQIDREFAIMALCPQHTFQVPTKWPERAKEYLSLLPARSGLVSSVAVHIWGQCDPDGVYEAVSAAIAAPLPNVWIGTSVENQETADERIPHLLNTPAAVRFVSAEPLLGPVDLEPWADIRPYFLAQCEHCHHIEYSKRWATTAGHDADDGDAICPVCGRISDCNQVSGLDWVIVGGESGPGARPMHPDWARSLRDQCEAAGTAFFFKQWGEYLPFEGGQDPANNRYLIMYPDGSTDLPDHRYPAHDLGEIGVCPVGKKRAGHLLDGVEHQAYPEARS